MDPHLSLGSTHAIDIVLGALLNEIGHGLEDIPIPSAMEDSTVKQFCVMTHGPGGCGF